MQLPKEAPDTKKYKQALAYEYLKNSIITGRLPPEKQLIEREICEKLGLSRTPVREAFRQLGSEGLVDFLPGRGVVVSSLTQEKAQQLYELKQALECMAARLCALRAEEKELEAMGECIGLHQQSFSLGRLSMAADVDLQFHVLLLEAAHSPMLEQEGKSLLLQARRLSQLAVYDADQTENFIAQHREILTAIEARDPDRAAAAVSRHIDFVQGFQWDRWEMLF